MPLRLRCRPSPGCRLRASVALGARTQRTCSRLVRETRLVLYRRAEAGLRSGRNRRRSLHSGTAKLQCVPERRSWVNPGAPLKPESVKPQDNSLVGIVNVGAAHRVGIRINRRGHDDTVEETPSPQRGPQCQSEIRDVGPPTRTPTPPGALLGFRASWTEVTSGNLPTTGTAWTYFAPAHRRQVGRSGLRSSQRVQNRPCHHAVTSQTDGNVHRLRPRHRHLEDED